jgi:hypothetical protein
MMNKNKLLEFCIIYNINTLLKSFASFLYCYIINNDIQT